jgi:hypothetical protein
MIYSNGNNKVTLPTMDELAKSTSAIRAHADHASQDVSYEDVGSGEPSAADLFMRIQKRAEEKKRTAIHKKSNAQASADGVCKFDVAKLKPFQIPLWDHDKRAIPHDLVRCALFTSRQISKREYFEAKAIASLGHLSITYTGLELRQRDLDVYLQLLHLARGQKINPQNPWVQFNGWELVRSLGWSCNKRTLQELRGVLTRLTACVVEITKVDASGAPKAFYGGGLLHEYAAQIESGSTRIGKPDWQVIINTNIADQIMPGAYAKLDWGLRKQLSPLGRWVHSFYASQRKPYPIGIEKLRELSFYARELKLFKYDLKMELNILANLGFLSSWEVTITESVVVSLKSAETRLPPPAET